MDAENFKTLIQFFFTSIGIVGFCLLVLFLYKRRKGLTENTVLKEKIDYTLYKYYPKEKHSKYQLYKYRKMLVKMDQSYTSLYDYTKTSSYIFMKEPSISPDPRLINDKMSYYNNNNIRLKDVALANIKELIKNKSILIGTKEYYRRHLLNAKETILILKSDSRNYGFEGVFKQVFQQRIKYLESIYKRCELIESELNSKISECDTAIFHNEQLVKTNVLEKVVDTAFSIVTAPIRHGANLVDGISSGDSKKAWKSGALLGLAAVGVGAVGDVLDVLDGLDSIDPEFVNPFERTLEDGTTIWVDGDGNTDVDLTAEEGGGFYRRVKI